jgi:hypothetical protein
MLQGKNLFNSNRYFNRILLRTWGPSGYDLALCHRSESLQRNDWVGHAKHDSQRRRLTEHVLAFLVQLRDL